MANEFKHKDPGSTLTQTEFIASDGTGHIFESQAAGDVLYASSTTVLARLAKATDGNVLELASGLPAWTGTPTIGSTSWSNANHAHGATNSGGTLNTSALGAGTLAPGRGGTGITSLGSNVATFLGTPSSSNLASAVTGETGSGELVFGTSPTLVTPALGTPASGTLTNATGLPTAGMLDDAVTLAKMADLTRGSIIYGDSSGDPAALAKGTEDYVLTAGADDIAWAAAGGGGAVAREGGNTTEASTTSTSETDILTTSSLTLTATQPIMGVVNIRKTSGSVHASVCNWKFNTTTANDLTWADASNETNNSLFQFMLGSRITNYAQPGFTFVRDFRSSVSDAQAFQRIGDMITVEITDVVLRGSVGANSITMSADEMHLYSYATS
jgi:hypothetical protein